MHEDVRRLLGVVHHDVLVEEHSRYGVFFRFINRYISYKLSRCVHHLLFILAVLVYAERMFRCFSFSIQTKRVAISHYSSIPFNFIGSDLVILSFDFYLLALMYLLFFRFSIFFSKQSILRHKVK